QTTNFGYDSFGRVIKVARPDGTNIKIEYLLCCGSETCPTNGAYLVKTTPFAADGATQNGPITKVYRDTLSREIATDVEGFDGAGTDCTISAPCWIRVDTQYDVNGYLGQKSRPYFLTGGAQRWTTYSY